MWGVQKDRFVDISGHWVRGSSVARISPDTTGVHGVAAVVELVNGSRIPTAQSIERVLYLLTRDMGDSDDE